MEETKEFNQSKRRIIGFAGRKRSGKGLLTEAIHKFHQKDGRPVVTITIAGALKQLCADLLGMTVEQSLAIKDNGTVLNVVLDDRWVDTIHEATGIDREKVKEILDKKRMLRDVREVLQFIGTDVIRKYYPNWHIDQAVKKMFTTPENAVILVDDVRFPNELEAFEKVGGEVFFIVRPSCLDITNHTSDTSLHWYDFDQNYVLSNRADAETFVDGFITWYEYGVRSYKAFAFQQRECLYAEYGNKEFGLNPNRDERLVIENILSQNTNVIGSYGDGTLQFKPETKEDKQLAFLVMGKQERIVNPLIIENLKIYM